MCLPFLHEYVVTPADKASNKLFLLLKIINIGVWSKNLGFPRTLVILLIKILCLTKKKFRQWRIWWLTTLSWIPKLHNNLYRERYIDISSTCSTKRLSITMTKFLSVVKDWIYNDVVTKSIPVVSSIKYGYRNTLKPFWTIFILILFWKFIYANIWLFYTLHYHSSWEFKNLFQKNHSICILLSK